MANDQQERRSGLVARVLTVPNLVSVGVGLMVFWVIAGQWRTPGGTIAAAIIGSLITAGVWLLWMRLIRGPSIASSVDEPILAYIPTTEGQPTPTLGDPDSEAARTYLDAVAGLERATKGQVVLVSSSRPGPGLGSSTCASR